MGRIAGEMKNAISVYPEEISNWIKVILIWFAVLAGLLSAGCAQHNPAVKEGKRMPPALVRVDETAPVRPARVKDEPAILGLAEEQDIESSKSLR